MSTSICFYFQVHQPYRLRDYSVFDVGNNHDYFDHDKNRAVAKKVAQKSYLPANAVMLEMLNTHPDFKISYSISGVALEQFEAYTPEVIDSFKRLVETGRVEILSETYYHSLAFLYSRKEFIAQIEKHRKKVNELFGVSPTVFRNTELIYNNDLAHLIESLGYKGILTEGADHVLEWRSPNMVYRPKGTQNIKLLMKNYKLSDDIAFRFSNKLWNEYPLTAPKFANWLSTIDGDTINLFMDYETFGEHQWEDTGIFDFIKSLPYHTKDYDHLCYKTPGEVVDTVETHHEMDIHHLISWADMERDLSAWLGNKMQQSAIKEVYLLEDKVRKISKNSNISEEQRNTLVADWEKLLTSDHFYYMCTKWWSDGDVHKYFSPYESPYEAFIYYMNVLNDMIVRIQRLIEIEK